MSANTKMHQDAPKVSGRVLKQFVAVTYEIEQLNESIKVLREFLDTRGEGADIGVRIVGCMLHVHILGERLIAMELAAREA